MMKKVNWGKHMKKIMLICLLVIVAGCGLTDPSNVKDDGNGNVTFKNNGKKFDVTISGVIEQDSYEISEQSYVIDPGEDVLEVVSNWEPLDAKVIFGLIHAQTGEAFWEAPRSGGNWQGKITTSHVKAGNYYIAIKTEKAPNVIDDGDHMTVTHFKWRMYHLSPWKWLLPNLLN